MLNQLPYSFPPRTLAADWLTLSPFNIYLLWLLTCCICLILFAGFCCILIVFYLILNYLTVFTFVTFTLALSSPVSLEESALKRWIFDVLQMCTLEVVACCGHLYNVSTAKIPVWGKVLKFENHLKNVVFVYYLPEFDLWTCDSYFNTTACVCAEGAAAPRSFWPPYTPVFPLCVQFAAVLQEIRKIIITRCFTCCETKLPSSHPVKCGLRGIKWVVREAWQRRLSSGLLFKLSLHLSPSLTHTNKQEVVWSSKDGVKQTGLHTSHLLLSQSKKQNQKSNNDLRGASTRHRAGRQGHWGVRV